MSRMRKLKLRQSVCSRRYAEGKGKRDLNLGHPKSQALSNPVTSTHVCPAGSKPVVIGIVTFVHSIFFSVHSKEHKIGI